MSDIFTPMTNTHSFIQVIKYYAEFQLKKKLNTIFHRQKKVIIISPEFMVIVSIHVAIVQSLN